MPKKTRNPSQVHPAPETDPERVKLYFLSLAARDIENRCENDIGIRGHSDCLFPFAIA
jgi:hypothetical protein